MTRTLWVSNDFPPRPGGIEQFLVNLVRRLDPSETRVLTAHWAGDTAYDAAQAWRIDRIGRRPLLPTPALARTIRAAAREHDAQVVVFGVAWPLAELAPQIGLPALALTMGHEAGMARVGLGPLVARIAARVDALGALSRFTRDQLAPWTHGRAPVHMVVPGVDIEQFDPKIDGSPVRARHGIPQGVPLTVCLSRLVHRKGQDVLIEAWPGIRARIGDARLLIVGTGPLRHLLRRRIHDLGLDGLVVLTGEAAWGDLPTYYAAADVFAMPCRTRKLGLDVEGLGIVYLEAQACGVPVVAGASGGAPETVRDGETGFVVDGRSPTEVGAAVAGLLADPERRAAMGRAGRAFVEESWAWPVVTADLERILADLASRR
ncbi:MAG: glycosyltransferase [Nitriliruptorales bacterium]|nr:glycosyltransferase [Nitriliruptorales bacterium]